MSMFESADQKINKLIVDEEFAVGSDTNATDASAISIATPCTILTSGGAETRTLGNGVEGQRKILVGGATVSGNITITPTNLQGYTSIVIGAAGRGCELLFAAGQWHCFSLGGATIS
jgi:hypothetical protein